MYGLVDAEFVDTSPNWTSSDKSYTGDIAWGDVDNDGDLDLAVGNFGYNYLYLNDNGTIPTDHSWRSSDQRDTFDLAWADFDSDGDIDLAAGNRNSNDILYLNTGGRLQETPVWNSSETDFTTTIRWGDVDSDGDLDLAVAHYPGNLTIYSNVNGKLTVNPTWKSREYYYAHTIILGDINNDDKIDMLVGNGKLLGGDRNYVFFNTGSGFLPMPNWWTQNPKRTTAMDLGDYDKDGDLDLAFSTLNQGTYVHDNVNNNLTIKPSWSAGDTSTSSYDIAWGDVTGNGYLDLVLAVNGKNKIYKNTGGTLETFASWHTDESDGTSSIGLADLDGDSDLDVGFGSDLPNGEPNYIYENNGTVYPGSASWTTTVSSRPNGVFWHDLDDDGDLDLAVGTNGRNVIYYNQGTNLFSTSGWSSTDSSDTRDIAWGDLDGDGDLDLIAGNYGTGNIAYRNNYGSLTTSAWWNSGTSDSTTAVVPGDVDSDGDLDLVVGNFGGPDRIYLNTGSSLSTSPSWSSNDTSQTTDIALGDMDNDNKLDMAVAIKSQGVRIYQNTGSMISQKPVWTSKHVNDTRSVGWADVNGDGFMDLITGAYSDMMYIYLNNDGNINTTPSWQQIGSGQKTIKNYLVDLNGDGRTDVFEVNDGQPNRIFPNIGGSIRKTPSWTTSASGGSTAASFGDMDKDGDLDIAVANSNGLLEIYMSTNIIEPLLINNPTYIRILSPAGLLTSADYSYGLPYENNIAIKYTLYDPEGAPAWVLPEYSTDAGGTWYPATASGMSGDGTTGLTATPTGKTYTFLWDSKIDNIVSKNVMFRLTVNSIHDVAGRVQKSSISAHTGVFPVDSTKLHAPLNLRVTGVSTVSISLGWTAIADEQVSGYDIFMNVSGTGIAGPYQLVQTVSNVTSETISGLDDGVTYHFKIRSFDSGIIRSIFSNIATGTTIPRNLPPRTLKDLPDIEMDEDTKLFNYLDLNDHFLDELSDASGFGSDKLTYEITTGIDINCWISPNEMLSIEPPPNYFGSEEFIVTANDTIFSVSMTFNVTVRSVNDPPILNLTDGTTFYLVQGEWINITITGYDPADPHDILTFWDNSSLFDIEAETGNISFNPLPWDVGKHFVNISLVDSGTPNLQKSARVEFIINSTYSPPKSEPPISTLIYPENDRIIPTLKPSFMWDGRDKDSPVIWYDVYLANDIQLVRELNFFSRIATRTTNITITPEEYLTNGEIYYWTVIPFDGLVRGFCESEIWKFSVDVSQPEPVVKLLSPANGRKVNSETVRLSWQLEYDGTEIVKYYVYLDTSPVPKTVMASDITEQTIDVMNLVDGETYYWTVRPRAGDVVGISTSGTWSFSINLNFTQVYCVSLITQSMINVKINETKLHDITIINCGNDVDIFLVSLIAGDLEGSVSLSSEWLTLTDLGSGFLELEADSAITISLLFGIHNPALVGVHTIDITVTSLGAQYSDLKVMRFENITVNVLDESGNGNFNNFIPDPGNNTGPSTNNTNSTGSNDPGPAFYKISMFNWFWIILAIIFAIMFLVIYTSYLMRKTRKKFEVYKTAQQILESKKIDSASPIVAGFLAAGTAVVGGNNDLMGDLGDVELTETEAETITAAFIIGSGRYTQAEEELSLEEHPYRAAAAMVTDPDEDVPIKKKKERKMTLREIFSTPPPRAYNPEYFEIMPVSPYKVARRELAMPINDPEVARYAPMAAPMVLPSVVPVAAAKTKSVQKGSYQPEHVAIATTSPYDTAKKMVLLEKKLQEGRISKKLYANLKEKYAEAKPALPVAAKAVKAYRPDYMYLGSEKPYDAAAKRVKLDQAFREGKIGRRLYEELSANYM